MANASVERYIKRTEDFAGIQGGVRNEGPLILSTTYSLNFSDTKRLLVGLRANEDGAFEPTIKLAGNGASGIYFNSESWIKFQENVERGSKYLRGVIWDAPSPIPINDVMMHFTTAYGARAIMICNKHKGTEAGSSTAPQELATPPAKKRKTYYISIVMQRTSFDGLESVIKCVNARYKQLNSLVDLVNKCARFLIAEIELNLPKQLLDEDVVKQTLSNNKVDIERNMLQVVKDMSFLDTHFEIIFAELTSIYLNEITRTIIMNATS